jgi:hypothetical protein
MLEARPESVYIRAGVEVRPSTPKERTEYLNEFGKVIDIFTDLAGGREGWWVIGGMARDAYLGNDEFVVGDTRGNWRDVDFLTTDRNKHLIEETRRRYKGPIPIDGTSVQHFIELPDTENVKSPVLKFGALKVSVPKSTFDTVNTKIGRVEFPTLPAQTLFHLYAVGDRPDGKMRKKDHLNAIDLARYIRHQPDPEHPDELYEGFHRFAREKNRPGQVSITSKARNVARKYIDSPLNKRFPINKGYTGQFALKIYDLVQNIEQQIEGNR